MRSMMSWIGEKIDKIFEKAIKTGEPWKAFLLAFAGGFVDGVMTWWAIFGLIFTITAPIIGLVQRLKGNKEEEDA